VGIPSRRRACLEQAFGGDATGYSRHLATRYSRAHPWDHSGAKARRRHGLLLLAVALCSVVISRRGSFPAGPRGECKVCGPALRPAPSGWQPSRRAARRYRLSPHLRSGAGPGEPGMRALGVVSWHVSSDRVMRLTRGEQPRTIRTTLCSPATACYN
jgi:hypothetical protein